MANMYDKPVDLKFINTYVSPNFDAMLKAGSAIQARADKAEEGQGVIEDAFSNIKALKWAEEDVKKRDNIIAGYQDRIDKKIEEVGGDYSKLLPFMRGLHKEVKKDLLVGEAAQLNSNYATWNADYAAQDALQETSKITTDAFKNRQQRLQQAYIDQGGIGEKGNLRGIQGMNAIQTPGDIAKVTMELAGKIKQMNRTQQGKWVTNNQLGSGEVKSRKTVSTEKLSSEKIEKLVSEYMSKDPKYESYFKQIADDKKWKYKGQLENVGVDTWTEERTKYGGGFTEEELKYFKKNNLTEENIENYSERKWYNDTKYNDVNELAAIAGDMKEVNNRKTVEANWTDTDMLAKRKDARDEKTLREAGINLGESLSIVTPKKEFDKRVEEYNRSKEQLPAQKEKLAQEIKDLNLFTVGSTTTPLINAVKNLFGGSSWGATVQEYKQDSEARRKQEENNLKDFSDQLTGDVEEEEYSNWKADNEKLIASSSENDIANYYFQKMAKDGKINEDGSPKKPYETDPRTGAPLSNKRNLIDTYMRDNGVSENEAKDVIGNIEKGLNNYRTQVSHIKVTDAKLSGIKNRVMENFTPSDWNTAYTDYTTNLSKYNSFSKSKTLTTGEYGEVIPMSKDEFKNILINANSKEEIDDAMSRSFGKAYNKSGTYEPNALESWATKAFQAGDAQSGTSNTGLENGKKTWKVEATSSLYDLWDKAQDGIALADNKIGSHYGLISAAWEKGTPSSYLTSVFSPDNAIKNNEIINEAGETTNLLELWPGLAGMPEDAVKIVTKFTPNIGNASYVTHVYEKTSGKQIGQGRLLHLPWKDEEIDLEMAKLKNSDRPTLKANADAYFGFKGMPNISVDDLTLMHSGENLPLHINGYEVGKIEKFGTEVSGFPGGGWAIVGVDPSTGESQVISRVESALQVGEAVEGVKSSIPSR